MLHLDEVSGRWFTWRTWLESQGVSAAIPPPKLLYPNYPLLLQAAVAGEGVALGWHGLIDDLLARHWVVTVTAASVRPRHGFFLCVRERRAATQAKQAAVAAVAAWFVRAASDGPHR